MAAKPMLDGVELQQVQQIEGAESESFNRHEVPGLEGDFFQDLGRRATRVALRGVWTGPDSPQGLETLRNKFRAAAPVTFVADIAVATRLKQMLIERMSVRELAGKPDRFEYALTMVEVISQAKPSKQSPLPRTAPPRVTSGRLRITARRVDEAGFDSKETTLLLDGVRLNGQRFSKTLSSRSGNTWSEEDIPPGRYIARVAAEEPEMFGSAPVVVRPSHTARVAVTLHTGTTVARAFVVHFSPANSFIEPPMRTVLQQAAAYAHSHPAEQLLITGHADAADGEHHRQISEQRARTVFAALTFGRDPAGSIAEWNAIRESSPSHNETAWGSREYQKILQDLGYFQGQIGQDAQLTDSVMRDFQLDQGLPADGIADDATWSALIRAYLDQNPLAISETRFLPEIWSAFGNERMLRNTRHAWRPNRRAELLFVKPGTRPSDLAEWVILPAESASITVRGSIRFNDGAPAREFPYTLIAPDGECLDGELPTGPERGSLIPGRTAADGTFEYPECAHRAGIYSLEVSGPFLARLAGEPLSSARGACVSKHLDGSGDFDIKVSQR